MITVFCMKYLNKRVNFKQTLTRIAETDFVLIVRHLICTVYLIAQCIEGMAVSG